MTLQQFINSYRISTAGSYYERLDEARLFVSDALEATTSLPSYIQSNAAMLYDVCVTDI
jgi:hypothetical protein|tara:strand:- start:1398 stop:1574 length:177 start_codon:yes stop_codon:yes gene_type:complete